MKKDIIGRFRYLWTWELVNALVIFPAFIWSLSWSLDLGWWAVMGTALLSLNLFAVYDFKANFQLTGVSVWLVYGSGRVDFAGLFRALRLLIPLLFIVLMVTMIPGARTASTADIVVGLLTTALALLEYINYFHFQLMYDNAADIAYFRRYNRLKRGIIARAYDW